MAFAGIFMLIFLVVVIIVMILIACIAVFFVILSIIFGRKSYKRKKEGKPYKAFMALQFVCIGIAAAVVLAYPVYDFFRIPGMSEDYIDTDITINQSIVDIQEKEYILYSGEKYKLTKLFGNPQDDYEDLVPFANIFHDDRWWQHDFYNIIYSVPNDAGVTLLYLDGEMYIRDSEYNIAQDYYTNLSEYDFRVGNYYRSLKLTLGGQRPYEFVYTDVADRYSLTTASHESVYGGMTNERAVYEKKHDYFYIFSKDGVYCRKFKLEFEIIDHPLNDYPITDTPRSIYYDYIVITTPEKSYFYDVVEDSAEDKLKQIIDIYRKSSNHANVCTVETAKEINDTQCITLNGVKYYRPEPDSTFYYRLRNLEALTPVARVSDNYYNIIFDVPNDAGVRILWYNKIQYLTHEDAAIAEDYYRNLNGQQVIGFSKTSPNYGVEEISFDTELFNRLYSQLSGDMNETLELKAGSNGEYFYLIAYSPDDVSSRDIHLRYKDGNIYLYNKGKNYLIQDTEAHIALLQVAEQHCK